jgi:GNAT superfamily N-acetyltransferase
MGVDPQAELKGWVPDQQKEQPPLFISAMRETTPNTDSLVSRLALFVARQPRFSVLPESDRQAAANGILQRIQQGLRNGRTFTVAEATLGEQKSILAYLESKSTGEFREDFLETLHDLASARASPKRLFDLFVAPDLPNFQLKGGNSSNWDLEGSFRYLFSLYEAEQDRPGQVGFLMLAEVDPSVRHLGLSKHLLTKVLEAFRREGTKFVVTFARCAQLAEWEPDPLIAEQRLQEYVALRNDAGLHPDFGIRFHQKAGARVICGLPHCARDPEAHNHMCLMIYNLAELDLSA